MFLATALLADYTSLLAEWTTRFWFGLGSALALAGGVELDRSLRYSAPSGLRLLGAASYSIYLTHILTLTFLAKFAVALHLPAVVPPLIAFVGLAGGAVLVGVIVHYLVERPIIAATRAIPALLSPVAPAAAKAQSQA